MNKISLIALFQLLLLSAIAQTKDFNVEGFIYLDTNENGRPDEREKGLKGIPVSNGDTIVITNSKGKFVIPADSTASIFPIVPTGFENTGSKIGNANFIFLGKKNTETTLALGLKRVKQASAFRVGAIGDLQVSNQQEISYANHTVLSELASSNIDFTIFLGDLVNNNINDLSTIRHILEKLPTKSWTVAGNHDRNFTPDFQQHTFNMDFGASDYAFNYAGVHFIVLNDIFAVGAKGYEGRLTEKQLRFIKNDLALVSKEKLVVISQHIPMVSVKNKADLLSLLEPYRKVLILSGHTHKATRHHLAPNVMEIVTGASCGNWWSGERNWQGMPVSLMQCGSPRNYYILDFEDNDYRFQFKGIGLDPSLQMTVWINGQDTLSQHISSLQELKTNDVLANVYAASDETLVKMKIDDGEWISMKKTKIIDPNVARIVHQNKTGIYPTVFSRKAALRTSASPHIWQGELPENLSSGVHLLTIEAVESDGFNVSAKQTFFVK
ncbi:Ser/Thr phosphatase [Maribellus luteus]|uniref:Ser/Thr phosphatase n=1 Tax=Maribellus luteus TaxID=2305463 RepID=A0A399T2D0_9BACT|nr:calcineurin-like phosphoesterase family protein [Maribellus luteus]RIJ50476.1 Ser/Thr phosphatase [Maribellus luteus]